MLAQLSLWMCLALNALSTPTAAPLVCQQPRDLPVDFHSPVSPPCLSGIINNYTPVLGFGCDSSSLQVGTLAGFAAGDKVLLLQMQVPQVDLSNTANFGTLLNATCIGNYEFNRIQSLGGSTIQLQFALTRPYDVSGKVQLVRVPEYDSATVCNLTCLPWNGSIGGVLALDVKTQLTLSGNLDVSGKGFRGGIVESNIIPWVFAEMQYFYPPFSTLAAAKGEGIVSIPTDQSFGRGRAGNGGGGGNAHNAGGGGGGNAGAGGNGGYEILNLPGTPTPNTNGIGGQKYFNNQVNKILLGGGAGAGHANDGNGNSGGTGGGIVVVLANTLKTNNFRILANGVDVFGGAEQNDGQGGGGGGGTVVLQVGQITGILGCELKGGEGGSNPYTPNFQLHGPGGGGGGGKLLLTQNSPNVLPSLQGGINGLTSQNLPHGAQPGEAGKMLTGFALPQGTQPAHPVSNHMLLAVQSPPCAGLATGQIAILHSTALAFRLNGGPWQPDSIFTNLAPGVYAIGLRFSGGCTLDTLAILTAPPPVQDSLLAITGATCVSGGAISVAAVSGTGPFSFQLDGGAWQSSGLFTDLLSGNHTITLRDAVGCTHASTYAVTAATLVLDSLLAITDANCVSGGAISVAALSGTAPFSFQLNGGAWQPSGYFPNLQPGNYAVTLRDAAGCTQVSTYAVATAPPLLDSLLAITGATCISGGTISVAALSGTAPFEFQLDGGAWQSNGSFANLPAGSYTVTLRDAAGCTQSSTYAVAATPPLLDSLLAITVATCVSGGTISVAAVSGTAPFEFQLNNGPWQSNGAFANLPAGSYTVTLRDAAGCTQSGSYQVTAPSSAMDSLLAITGATCLSGGAVSVAAVSGTAPFEFQLNGGAWQPNGSFTDLPAGSYTITLRDATGCTQSGSYVVPAPPPALDSLLAITDATCISGGAVSVAAISGTAPFEFQVNGGPWQPNGAFANLPAGSYTVTLRDAAGCTQSGSYAVVAPPPALDSLLAITDATCVSGGAISVAAVSGSAPFSFQLDGGAWQPNGAFTDLPPGSYTITLRDAAGCTDVGAYVVAAPPSPLDSLLAITAATCVSGGAISVGAVSGSAPFSFQLDGGTEQPNGVFTDLPPGSYTIKLRDAIGCTHTGTYAVPAPLPVLDSLLAIVAATCISDGAFSVGAISGTAPFSFQLDGGAWQPSGSFANLPPGNYTVTLLDAAGCTHASTYAVDAPPPALDSLLAISSATCVSGGAISVAAISGTAPYAFQLDGGAWQPSGSFANLPPGSYTITLRDAAGCTQVGTYAVDAPPPALDSLLAITAANCISGGTISVVALSGTTPYAFQLDGGAWQPTGTFANLPSGSYTVTLRDAAGCTQAGTYTVPAPPPALDSLLAITAANCVTGGAISVVAVSGTAPYVFQLNGGAWQPNGSFTDLPPGSYTVTLRDAAGCTHANTYPIMAPPLVLDSLLGITDATCVLGGAISVAPIAGTAPFDFQLNGGAWQPNGAFANLPPGNYTVTLRDAAGCTHTSIYTVHAPPLPLDLLLAITAATCTMGGTISVTAVAGTPPFEFQLDGGPWQSTGSFANLPPGNYTVTLRDAAGCTHQSSYLVPAAPPATDSLLAIAGATCTKGGAISIAAVSGTAPFFFQLGGGAWQSSGSFADLLPGNYTVTLRDAAGCTHSSTYTITAPPPALDSLLAITNATCISGGAISVVAVSGTAPYAFQLDGGAWQPSGSFANLPPGNYTVTLRDAVGCTHTDAYLIALPPPLALALDSLGNIDCRHAQGRLSVSATGGSGSCSYQLAPSGQLQGGGYFSGLAAGVYAIIATDSLGCEARLEDLEVADLIDTALTHETVTIYEDAYFELPDGSRIGRAGQYTFTFMSQDGCDSVHIIDLIVLKRHVYVPNVFSPNEDGANDFFAVFSDESLAVVRRLQVFDRWGELVFEKQNLLPNRQENGWDGNFRGHPVGAGVFTWLAELDFVDGLQRTIWGDVTVVR